jgi:hypothetical protein
MGSLEERLIALPDVKAADDPNQVQCLGSVLGQSPAQPGFRSGFASMTGSSFSAS